MFDPSPHPLISPTTSQSDVFKGEEENEHKKEGNDENKSTFLAFVGLRRISHHKKTGEYKSESSLFFSFPISGSDSPGQRSILPIVCSSSLSWYV